MKNDFISIDLPKENEPNIRKNLISGGTKTDVEVIIIFLNSRT